jgi:hypothetical protein
VGRRLTARPDRHPGPPPSFHTLTIAGFMCTVSYWAGCIVKEIHRLIHGDSKPPVAKDSSKSHPVHFNPHPIQIAITKRGEREVKVITEMTLADADTPTIARAIGRSIRYVEVVLNSGLFKTRLEHIRRARE